MLARLINWIFLLALLMGCAAPPTPVSPARPSSTLVLTPMPIDSLAPTVISTPAPVVLAEERDVVQSISKSAKSKWHSVCDPVNVSPARPLDLVLGAFDTR